MDDPDQSLPKSPSSSDSNVQSGADTLSEDPSFMDSTKHLVDFPGDKDPTLPCADAVAASPRDTSETEEGNRTSDGVEKPEPSGELKEDVDEGAWQERAPWAPPPSPSPRQHPITGFTDPVESEGSQAPTKKATSDALPQKRATWPPSHSPTLSTFFRHAITYFSSCIGRYFITTTPSVVEYSASEILRNTRLDFEAEEIQLSDTSTEIRLVVVVTDSLGAYGEGHEKNETTQRRMELRGKPKRVREIMRRHACYVAEDWYGDEIRVAFRHLRTDVW
jgi:hypothetical protein